MYVFQECRGERTLVYGTVRHGIAPAFSSSENYPGVAAVLVTSLMSDRVTLFRTESLFRPPPPQRGMGMETKAPNQIK